MLINEYTEKLSNILKGYVLTRIQDVENKIITSGGGVSANPAGTVISGLWMTPPVGYLPCDGSLYNVADYDVLYDILSEVDQQTRLSWNSGADWVTTFATPDLRGEFIRGSGTNSHANQGSGASVGVHQDATKVPVVRTDGSKSVWIGNPNQFPTNVDGDTVPKLGGNLVSLAGNITAADYGIYYLSRPTNTSLLFVIKY